MPYQNLRVDVGVPVGVRNLMTIERWPEAERPRERLYWNGPEALADAELLAIQLGSGTRGRSAVDVAREMLAAYGSLAEVAARDVTELAGVAGVGPAKAARLAATFELTRRLRARRPGVRIVLSSPAEAYAAFAPLMEDLTREVFRVALLDAQNGLLRDRVISEGTLSASLVHPYQVFKPAILESAASVVLLHNHPSGDPTPSREDVRLTRQLVECARLLELRVHDHLEIGDRIDDLRAAKAHLEAHGVAPLRLADHRVSKSIYLTDPDGNGLELFVDADPAIWREDPGAVASVEPLEL